MDSIETNCKHHRIPRNCYLCYMHRHDHDEKHYKTSMDTLHETLSELKIRIAKLEEYKRLQDDINGAQIKANDVFCDTMHDFEKELKKISDFQSVINQRWGTCVEHKNKQIDENRAASKHFDDLDSAMEVNVNILHEKIEQANNWILKVEKDLTLRVFELERLIESNKYVPFDEEDYDDEVEPPVILDMVDSNGEKVRFIGKIENPKETLCMDKFAKPKTTGLTFEEAIIAFKAGKKIKLIDEFSCAVIYEVIHDKDKGYGFQHSHIFSNDWEIV